MPFHTMRPFVTWAGPRAIVFFLTALGAALVFVWRLPFALFFATPVLLWLVCPLGFALHARYVMCFLAPAWMLVVLLSIPGWFNALFPPDPPPSADAPVLFLGVVLIWGMLLLVPKHPTPFVGLFVWLALLLVVVSFCLFSHFLCVPFLYRFVSVSPRAGALPEGVVEFVVWMAVAVGAGAFLF